MVSMVSLPINASLAHTGQSEKPWLIWRDICGVPNIKRLPGLRSINPRALQFLPIDNLAGGGTCYHLVCGHFRDATIPQTCSAGADHLSPDFLPRVVLQVGSVDDHQVLDSYRMKVLR